MKRKNPAAVALGRLGGKAKAAKLTAEQRSESARKAGLAGGRGRKKAPPIIVTKEDVIALGMPAIKKRIKKAFGLSGGKGGKGRPKQHPSKDTFLRWCIHGRAIEEDCQECDGLPAIWND